MKIYRCLKRLTALLLVTVMVSVINLPTHATENTDKAVLATEDIKISLNDIVVDDTYSFTVDAPSSAMYSIGMSYVVLGDGIGDLEVSLKVNGEYPFEDAKKLIFSRIWKDESENRIDGLGNQFAPKQIPYDGYYFSKATDVSKNTDTPYFTELSSGKNEITLTVSAPVKIEYFVFGKEEVISDYKAPDNSKEYYGGTPIVIEAESPLLKSSYWLSAKNDNSSLKVTPNSASKTLVNYIGGDNWKTTGETIIWETPELEAGYYQLGISYRQSAVIGGKVYRKLTIDGEVPFKEAEDFGFEYGDNWQDCSFADSENNPYLIYLEEGKHEIGLTVVPGRISEVRESLEAAISNIGSLYIDITMVVGETVDMYRDYDLFSQIADMEERLRAIQKELNNADELLKDITGQESGSNSSVIKNMLRVVEQMLDNRYTSHRYKSEYYNKYTALAAVLYEMQNMPLDVDKLVLSAPENEEMFEEPNVFSKLWFSVEKFVYSFINDYNNISKIDGKTEPITIWVNWGRDQAQVLNSLAQTTFTEETGIPVNVQLVNASVVQAILSGKGPDCLLQRSRIEPVDLAMRGVLYNLSEFEDHEEVLKRFQKGADIPYRYNGDLYALPDTQSFFLMFYRKDILNQMGLSVPETWDEFKETAKYLARNNLSVWIPNNPVTDTTQASAGIGSINLFPSLLMQKGLEIYSNGGRQTNLADMEVMLTFSEWTDMYRKLKLNTTMDFYNRFRTGTCPIGINSYVLYTTLKAAAPEIDGLWGVAPIPSTRLSDGSISGASAGAGTGCVILKAAKNPDDAWEFLKWWTSSEIQLAFSNEIESVLGPTGRIQVSNVEAFKAMQWDSDMVDSILKAWSEVEEIAEYPGSYYVSRSVYQAFWNVVENNRNPKDMLIKYGRQADMEMERKWEQYENR